MNICSITDCNKPRKYIKHGWCNMHGNRYYRHGNFERLQIKSGLSKTRNSSILKNMKNRCLNPKCKAYPDYGGRGIKICEQWTGPKGLINFVADMGIAPPNKSIDRINNDGNYEPGNCKWSTPQEQSENKRIYRTNKSGVSGVSWYKYNNKWRVAKHREHLGYTDTIEEAIELLKAG